MIEYKIEWEREFGKIADYRLERYKSKIDQCFYYLISNNIKTYLGVNGPFSSPTERDAEIIEDVKRRIEGYDTQI